MKVNTSDLPDVFVLLTEDKIVFEFKTEGGSWIRCVLTPQEGEEESVFERLADDHKSYGEPISKLLGESLEQHQAETVLSGVKAIRLYVTEVLPSLKDFNSLFRKEPECPVEEFDDACAGV